LLAEGGVSVRQPESRARTRDPSPCPRYLTPSLPARPGINGNSRGDFIEAYMALTDAREALQEALRVLGENVTNGRNYLHLSPSYADETCAADKRRTQETIEDAREALSALQSDIENILA
jgi:hypothetical protein